MKRFLALLTALVTVMVIFGCTESQLRGGGVGAGVGGIAGALLDHRNPWRGGLIGAALGGTFGATLGDISDRASRQAAAANKPVYYRTEDGRGEYRAEPVGYDERTRCKKIHERIWEDGRIVRDHVKEVCESERYGREYPSEEYRNSSRQGEDEDWRESRHERKKHHHDDEDDD